MFIKIDACAWLIKQIIQFFKMTIQKGKGFTQRDDQSPKPKLQHPKMKGRKKKMPKSKPQA